MEETIRYILLFVGAAIILGILFHGLKHKKRREEETVEYPNTKSDEYKRIFHEEILGQSEQAEPRISQEALKNISIDREKGREKETSNEATEIIYNEKNKKLNDEIESTELTEEAEIAEEPKEVASETVPEIVSEDTPTKTFFEERTNEEEIKEKDCFQSEAENSSKNVAEALEKENKHELPKIISIMIIAPSPRKFGGYDLLQVLSVNKFHHGEMQIFHYYDENFSAEQAKKPLFSLASANSPGDFNLEQIGAFSCNGLVLFMNVADHNDPAAVFDKMINTAQQLADDLEGELSFGKEQPFNEDIVSNIRRQLSI
jgi:cell division protein ZipA